MFRITFQNFRFWMSVLQLRCLNWSRIYLFKSYMDVWLKIYSYVSTTLIFQDRSAWFAVTIYLENASMIFTLGIGRPTKGHWKIKICIILNIYRFPTKWPPFYSRHFQILPFQWQSPYLTQARTIIAARGSIRLSQSWRSSRHSCPQTGEPAPPWNKTQDPLPAGHLPMLARAHLEKLHLKSLC